MKTRLTAVVVLVSIVLSGCVSMPKPLSGEFAGIRPADVANNPAVTGTQVRWGGSILKTYSDNGRSCMEILGQSLDEDLAKPVDPDLSIGRFVACKDNFLDPAVFAPGRQVTVTGRIEGIATTSINDFDYQYAVIGTDVLFLWPEDTSGYYAGSDYEQSNGYYVAKYRQPSYFYGYSGGFYSPFYYPYYFGGFGHGFYGPGLYRGFYNGFYPHSIYFGGFRGGFGYRNAGPRYTQPRQRQARRSFQSGSDIRASRPGAYSRSGSAGRSAPAINRQSGSATKRQ